MAWVEGSDIVTWPGVTRPWRSARVCSSVAAEIPAKSRDSGVGSYGVLAPSASSLLQGWVLCPAVPCQPRLAVPAGHGDTVLVAGVSPGRHAPSGTPSPALGSPLPRLPLLAAAVPGCNRSSGRCRCLCREPGEAAWKKAPCWEPASRCQEKQPPFGGAFQAADEINTARCRALCLPGRPPLPSSEWGN